MKYTVLDEVYQQHLFGVEVENGLRGMVRTQQFTANAVDQGFTHLGLRLADLEESLTSSLEMVSGQLDQLNDTLSWGLAEIAWRQEQTNELLRDVLVALRHPRATQAEELRERGNDMYGNGVDSRTPQDRQRWMDLALDDYQASIELHPSDFSVAHSIGTILFFEKGNSDDALMCFREAAALAEPYSRHHAAMSWLSLGYIQRNSGELEEAYRATTEAITLDPEWNEARYQHAIHGASTGRTRDMEESLVEAIESDYFYFAKASLEPELLSVPRTGDVLTHLTREIQAERDEFRAKLRDPRAPLATLLSFPSEVDEEPESCRRQGLGLLDDAQDFPAICRAIEEASDLGFTAYCTARLWENNSEAARFAFGFDFSPDGTLLAVAGLHGLALLRVGNREMVRELTVPQARDELDIHSVAFSPNGLSIAGSGSAGSENDGVWSWTVDDGNLEGEFELESGSKTSFSPVAFSPDSRLLASVVGGPVQIWSAANHRLVKSIPLPAGDERAWPTSMSFSPKGSWLALCGSDSSNSQGFVWVCNVETGRVGFTHRTESGERFNDLAFSADGPLFVAVSSRGTIFTWLVVNWDLVDEREISRSALSSISFSPDGDVFVVEERERVHFLGVSEKELLLTMNIAGHPLAFSPTGSVLN